MLDTPCSEVVWRVLATHSTRMYPLHFPYHASPCAIRFQQSSSKELYFVRFKICLRFQIFTTMTMKITLFWNVTSCSLVRISRVQLKCDGRRWRTEGEVKGKLENGVGSQYSSHYLGTWFYPALLPLMRTPRLPVVDWTDAPADLNGLVRFAERRNLVSARVPSQYNWPLPSWRNSANCEGKETDTLSVLFLSFLFFVKYCYIYCTGYLSYIDKIYIK